MNPQLEPALQISTNHPVLLVWMKMKFFMQMGTCRGYALGYHQLVLMINSKMSVLNLLLRIFQFLIINLPKVKAHNLFPGIWKHSSSTTHIISTFSKTVFGAVNLSFPANESENHQSTIDVHPNIVPAKHDEVTFPFRSSNTVLSNGLHDRQANGHVEWDRSSNYSSVLLEVGSGRCFKEHGGNVASIDYKLDLGTDESSIISNIMSIDYGVWEDSLTSPRVLLSSLGR
ncbi:hypothetical protein OIU78_019065 [Salix suchowensis]|nr:hypothetical protein OIU78_019065 [Salix suchowensis]